MRVLDNYVCEGQMSIFDLGIWFGKTCQEPSVQTKEKTSDAYLKKFAEFRIKPPQYLCLKRENGVQADVSWEMGGALLGEYTMHSFGEFPNEERGSRLSQILQVNPLPKYSLSAKACQGILRRAKKRGKELPPILKEALIRQSVSKNEQESPGGGKGILIQNERIGALSTLNNQSVVYCLQGNGIDRADTAGCNGKGWRENQSYTLNTIDRPAVCYNVADHPTPKIGNGEMAYTLASRDYKNPQAIVLENHPADSRVKISEDGVVQTLSSRMGTGGGNVPMVMENQTYQNVTGTLDCGIAKGTGNQLANQDMFVANQSVVRRLTPLECERLQGYPDYWTDIGEWTDSKGKKHKDADSPRYKALGNSIALPFWEWMAARMVKELNVEHPTMASLFDGIGGFPLVYSRCGCEPIWASEIEEFPIAVTKLRFPE